MCYWRWYRYWDLSNRRSSFFMTLSDQLIKLSSQIRGELILILIILWVSYILWNNTILKKACQFYRLLYHQSFWWLLWSGIKLSEANLNLILSIAIIVLQLAYANPHETLNKFISLIKDHRQIMTGVPFWFLTCLFHLFYNL